MPDIVDLSLEDDLAEVHREIQRRVDRVIAARVELADSIKSLNEGREAVLAKSAAAVAFVDNYMNPSTPASAPIAPDVAAPPPAVEPPVFTTVDTPALTPENTSGGTSSVTDVLILEPPQTGPTEEAIAAAPVGTTTEDPKPAETSDTASTTSETGQEAEVSDAADEAAEDADVEEELGAETDTTTTEQDLANGGQVEETKLDE